MQQKLKKITWFKLILLSLLLVVAAGLPISTISASTTSARTVLKNTITYCEKIDKSEYTSKSWKTFQTEIADAKKVYNKAKQDDKVYAEAFDKLEKAKANLVFVSSTEKGNPLPFTILSADQIVDEMGAGWNLGNTMDANDYMKPSETAWQPTVTTKALIKSIHDMGFNTIRVPVTWGLTIDDKNGYTIDDAWISRVQDIVDYAISEDMYVIINMHHDDAPDINGWLNTGADNIDYVYEKFGHAWLNIAKRFKDYDEHLIFESMNEVCSSKYTYLEDNLIINNLNQIFLNAVRSTGSNNSERWLSCPGRYTNIDQTVKPTLGFKLPTDTVNNRLFVSVHEYENSFCLTTNTKVSKCNFDRVTGLVRRLKLVTDAFTSKGIPVILGEYGAVNKGNTADRTYYYEAIARICQNDGVVAVAWDNAGYDPSLNPDYGFALVDRVNGNKLFPDIVDGIMRGTYLSGKQDGSDLVKSPAITKITSITLSDTKVTLTIGDRKDVTVKVKPAKTNDVVLWKTADPTIATVSNGHIRARGIGTTTLTAFSQNGTVQKTVTVTVNAKTSSKPCTTITTDKDAYDLAAGSYLNMQVSLSPSGTDDYVTFKSSNESVVTVNTLGKIVGISAGTADITITTSNGLTKSVTVTVTAAAAQ